MTAAQEILSAYDENPNAVFSINELARRVGKAYPSVHRRVQVLVQRGILTRTEVGRSHLCGVNLGSKQAVMLLALNETAKHDSLPDWVTESMQQLAQRCSDLGPDIGIYDPGSDTLYAVIPDAAAAAGAPELGIAPIRIDDLRTRLLEDERFYRTHIVITGYERFFSLLAEPAIIRRYHPLL